MSARTTPDCLGSVLNHNLSPEQRRAHFEAEATRYILEGRDRDPMSLEDLKALSDPQRLIAFLNGRLIGSIASCRRNYRLDTYFAVRDIIYSLADLSGRACLLSARQFGLILDRDEGTIRRVLRRLVDDGLVRKGEPQGRFGIVPHYPALDNLFLSQASPIWILNAFVPGLFARNEAGNAEYYEQVNGTPGVNATPSPLASTTPLASTPPPPLASKPSPAFSPLASKPVTPGVNACDPWRQRPTESLEESLEEKKEVSSLRSDTDARDEHALTPTKVVEVIDLEPVDSTEVRKPTKSRKKIPTRFPAKADWDKERVRRIWQDAEVAGERLTEEDARVEFLKMSNWAQSNDHRKADWYRTWDNWCLRVLQERVNKGHKAGGGSYKTAIQIKQDNNAILDVLTGAKRRY